MTAAQDIGMARRRGVAAPEAAASADVAGSKPVFDAVADELRKIQADLAIRLQRHPLSRVVFNDLAQLEYELYRSGYRALDNLSVDILRTALEQLHWVMGSVAGELLPLQTKLLEAVLERSQMNDDFGGNLALSVFNVPHKIEVSEARESVFFDAQRQWDRPRGDAGQNRAR